MKVCDLYCFTDLYTSLIISLVLGILYDFIRCLGIRKRCISDLIFIIIAFVFLLYGWIIFLSGCLRWYVVLSVISGLILYFLTISGFICVFLLYLNKKIRIFFHFIFKILLTLLHFLGKIIVCISRCFCSKS